MIQEIVNKWEKNKLKLEDYFRNNTQDKYNDYKDIVIAIIKLVINSEYEDSYDNYDIEKMTVVDDGDYQGTKLFLIPKNKYQPSVEDYIITNTYYGSCSGCDTLMSISDYSYDLPTDKQIEEYMTLSLHLIQKFSNIS